MNSYTGILNKGTKYRTIAMNWHLHVVPKIDAEIDELNTLISDVKNMSFPHDDAIKSLENDKMYMETVLNTFLKKWPRPVIQTIEDLHRPINIPVEWWEFVSVDDSLPHKPLTLRNGDVNDSHVLFYTDEDDNVYRCINIWYNRPNNRKIYHWDF